MQLILGSKNVSTWSLRPWILMKELKIPFEEIVIELDQPNTKAEILKHSPSGRVPCLRDGDISVWDSLAIIEYLAESNPKVWPQDKLARAWARSASAEMHSGFADLRKNLPGQFLKRELSYPKENPSVLADISRVQELWNVALQKWGGPFLCGQAFTAVDAMYAPVALGRFVPYGVPLDPRLQKYVKTLQALESSQEWCKTA